jgi:c-di-GMP-binding flagellar brake protein YcgR
MILRRIWCKCKRTKLPFIERRKYLRLDASVPVKYAVITKGEQGISHPAEYNTQSKNIGGGGLLIEVPLLVDEFCMTKHLLKVEIDLPDGQPQIHATAKMVCAERNETENNYHLRLSFVEIDEKDKQRIIKFVKKGLKKE